MDAEPSVILIVDDDDVDRRAVRRALDVAAPGHPVEEAEEAERALERLRARTYLCAFVDHQLPGRSGLELLQQVRFEGLLTPIVMLTGYGDELLAVEALKAGAADYLPKSRLQPERLALCLESARSALHSRLDAIGSAREVAERLSHLTTRERQVMELLVAGKSNKQIGLELGISRRTVESHRARLMEKMRVRSLAELVRCFLSAEPPTP